MHHGYTVCGFVHASWLHSLRVCACIMVTPFAGLYMLHGYTVCGFVHASWLHSLRVCAYIMVTPFAGLCMLHGYTVCGFSTRYDLYYVMHLMFASQWTLDQ